MSTQVQWLAPAPLWQVLSNTADRTQFRSPGILRFATDTFMLDLQSVLQNSPQTLGNYVAQAENWRNPGAGLDYTGPQPPLPFKLYQPTHARFYLIASSLTCRMPGLPDHTVNKTAGESVAFVVRQIRPNHSGYTAADFAVYDPTKFTEYAWIPGTSGATTAPGAAAASASLVGTQGVSGTPAGGTQNASGSQPGWMLASSPDMVAGEEKIPLSLTTAGSNGSSRRIFIGLIPASRRQQYITALTLPANVSGNGTGSSSGSGTTSGSSTGNGTPTDPRMDMFFRQIVAPWCNLEGWWKTVASSPSDNDNKSSILGSAYILYDFSTFLNQNINDVWTAIQANPAVLSTTLTSAEAALYNALSPGLRQALVNAFKAGPELEVLGLSNKPPSDYTTYALTDAGNLIIPTTLQTPVANALPPLSTVNAPVLPPNAQQPADAPGDYYFIVRCVYLRPQCLCNVVSQPCQPFQLASYFDSDAPARRLQVALPIDTSPAALRKYDKGVAFMMGKELRNQMARVASLDDLSKGTIGGEGSATVGWICSLSIPIITICAMILLMVIVIALNLVFFWIPFFKICLPVPGLDGE